MLRIKEFRKLHNLSQQELASHLGITQATLSGWENEKFEIDNKSLILCADLFGVSVDTLLGRSDTDSSPAPKKGIKIPVLGRVAAGIPVDAIEEILDYEEITQDMAALGEHFALQIHGDSMEPKFSEGDVVIVRKCEDVESGQLAIVLVNGGEAACKKFVKHDNGISLVSTNPKYAPMFYTFEEVEKTPISILGRVVELRAKF